MIVDSEKTLDKIAQEIIKYSDQDRIWIFYGEMGSGKLAADEGESKSKAAADH